MRLQYLMKHIPSQTYLWIAVTLFAASNSIVRKLTNIGTQHLIDGRNPISACNVLFVSNLCALMVLIPVFRRQLTRQSLQALSRQDWAILIVVSVLSGAIAPALIFIALSQAMVNNVILVGRIEPPLILALSVWILHDRLNRWEVIGTLISLVGVIFTITLQHPSSSPVAMGLLALGQGEILTILGVSAAAIATVISKAKLDHISLGLYTIVRLIVGTIVFFILAVKLYRVEHFIDVASPLLWQWMLLYGIVIVVIGQLCWFRGLRMSTTSEAALVNSFSPVLGIVAAYLILGEQPLFAHYVGGSIILLGLLFNQIGIWQKTSSKSSAIGTNLIQQIGARTGFKGI
ncbi:DMT family transporter [Pantanalinema sp. GBBB05]|uniref:DMT family transporter n=1 Tax=Pantanalinema sp. GBBB05 TaxID=2604139 RepID=UPI001D4EF4D7|nr:DMT family transporter [Pantanalinema sp. GBBB05]